MYKFELKDDLRTIVVKVNSVNAVDLLQDFMGFLRACGFHESTLYSSLEEILNEYKEEESHD